MHSQAVLLALAGAAAATMVPSHLAIKRDVEARQTDGADSSCVAEYRSLYSSMPTPPPAYVSYVEAHVTGDLCSLSLTVPSSIEALLSSYETEVASWAGAHRSDIVSIMSDCPQVAASLTASADGPSCTGDSDSGSGSSDASTTGSSSSQQTSGSSSSSSGSGSGSSSGSGSGSSGSSSSAGSSNGGGSSSAAGSSASAKPSTNSKNAGPRETGFAGAALAAAGFLGVVAAL